MKLYVWCDPYRVPYGSSMVLAVAGSLDEARAQALKGASYSYGQYSNNAPTKTELGEPDRVVDLPCAEWHEWAE